MAWRHDLVGVAVAQTGVVEQAPEDLGQLAGAELAAAHLGVLARQRLGGLGHADGVQLVGRERQPGVELDERLVQLGAVVEPPEAGALVGAGGRQELVAQGVPVTGEGRAQVVADDVGELAAPDLEAVPALRAGEVGERVGLQGRRQVAVHLVDGSLDVDAGGRAPGGQALAVALGGLVEHAPELAGPLQCHGGVLGLGRLQLGGGDQQVGVDPLHLVGRQLGEPEVDGPHGVVELLDQQVAGRAVGLVELAIPAVDGGGPLAQADPHRPQPSLLLGGQVVGAVVVAVVAEERGEQRAGLELGLPVLVGDGADGVGHPPMLPDEGRGMARQYGPARPLEAMGSGGRSLLPRDPRAGPYCLGTARRASTVCSASPSRTRRGWRPST